ncbi:T9SS type A sorting domain-containing protein [Lacinutrix sp. 5H-3-7-4]|uniref:T9SS type A sorting domain-containing protein n=1 Tax=Lacinutrix sp. (strain 5H-3-7-4) TaxID=983544 RepID=UPI00020A39B1|nr:T9SS type A sorting domain-containing protein [Lacinutrix sp. 5H-3-7-4]AEH01135.1 Carbohydrate-binding CenC domain protein [Lacinutrix sp. 5H-3-7-4]
MKKFYFLALTLIPFFGISQSIAVNGGFESFTGNTPDGWTLIDSGISTEEETTIINEGTKSLKITVNTATQGSTDFRQDIDVVAGVEYTYSVDIYHPAGDNDARARLYIDGYENYSDPTTTDSWQTLTTTFTPTTSGTIEVGLRFYDVSGFDGSSVIYVDNLLVTDPTLSTENFETTEFSVYPNPASNGFVNITTASNEAINVSVFDVLGKKVLSQTINNRLNVSTLKSGVYILNLNQNGATTTKKLVIK